MRGPGARPTGCSEGPFGRARAPIPHGLEVDQSPVGATGADSRTRARSLERVPANSAITPHAVIQTLKRLPVLKPCSDVRSIRGPFEPARQRVAQLSSTELAGALGKNRSLIRKLLSPLADAGLVRSSFGRDGGVRLGRPADAITLREIYSAVLGEKSLAAPRSVPHQCLVSSNVGRYFVDLAAKADDTVLRTLEHKTLADTLSELRVLDVAR
jgi:Rrf2 family transcriptional regulator, repressor of oqxAB